MRTLFPALSVALSVALGGFVHAGRAAAARTDRPPVVEPKTGILDIKSDPPARIRIDDNDTGKFTPQQLELPAGHHKLTLVTKDGAHTRTLGFNIQAGGTTQLTLHLASG